MEEFKKLCREMAEKQCALSFTELADAAVKGATVGQETKQPYAAATGAVLGVAVAASARALKISEKMLHELHNKELAKESARGSAKPRPKPN